MIGDATGDAMNRVCTTDDVETRFIASPFRGKYDIKAKHHMLLNRKDKKI